MVAVLGFFLPPLPEQYKDLKAQNSLILVDRNGIPLRRELSQREGVNRWVPLSDISPILQASVIRAEDKRFFSHPGVDPVAIARATWMNLRNRRVVSGASTISQQLIRTLEPENKRSLSQKLCDSYWALRLELVYSKNEILEAYLNRVAFAPNVYGVNEASRYYFHKPQSNLSIAEAAVLAVTIRAPVALDPFIPDGNQELTQWTQHLIQALENDGTITADASRRAQSEELELSPEPPPFRAPHFCDLVLNEEIAQRGSVSTTLDLELQESVEGLVKSHLALLKKNNVGNAAVVVADVESGDVLALVGSAGYHRRKDGQHNAAVALRQPGSTLKPFTYALLLERVGQAGFILPDLNLYEDADLESFIPKNYDKHFHGPVSIRTALACSYNVPAVRALERVGTKNLLQLLRRLGFSDLTQPPEHYGLGLTLGDGSTSLFQLVGAYRSLARGGLYSPLRLLSNEESTPAERIISPQSAYLISDILTDKNARIPSFGSPNSLEFPFPCAVKTGTSKGYRDNWTVGYTSRFVVGVWVGNSDGQPMRDVSGITGAGPLFRDVILTLGRGEEFSRPPGLTLENVCTLSGSRANAVCPTTVEESSISPNSLQECTVCQKSERIVFDMPPLYRDWAKERGLPIKAGDSRYEDSGLKFVFPLDQDVFITDPDLPASNQRVKLRAVGGLGPYTWSVNEQRHTRTDLPQLWWQLKPGLNTIEVRDSRGETKSLQLRVVGQLY